MRNNFLIQGDNIELNTDDPTAHKIACWMNDYTLAHLICELRNNKEPVEVGESEILLACAVRKTIERSPYFLGKIQAAVEEALDYVEMHGFSEYEKDNESRRY